MWVASFAPPRYLYPCPFIGSVVAWKQTTNQTQIYSNISILLTFHFSWIDLLIKVKEWFLLVGFDIRWGPTASSNVGMPPMWAQTTNSPPASAEDYI